MATQHGHQVRKWLEERGWKVKDEPHQLGQPLRIGDARMVDPHTGEEMSPYEGALRVKQRTGEYPDFLPDYSGPGQETVV